MELIVRWRNDTPPATREKIKRRFGIRGITVNGESRVALAEEDMADFRLTVERGWLTVRNKPLLHPWEKVAYTPARKKQGGGSRKA